MNRNFAQAERQVFYKTLELCTSFSSVQSLSCVRLFATPWSQHDRPPCPSPSPGVHSDSCPSSPWCHQAISSSVVPFSSCSQSLPASVSFPTSQLFAWGMASQPNSYLFISSYPTVSYPALLWLWVNGLLLWNVLAFFIWFIWWDLVRWGHILK